ncbi:MAG: hypothetical protein OQJ91_17805 [Motiliproteus sp.]|nr:hypothetical protein [Motiliproteus sp.]
MNNKLIIWGLVVLALGGCKKPTVQQQDGDTAKADAKAKQTEQKASADQKPAQAKQADIKAKSQTEPVKEKAQQPLQNQPSDQSGKELTKAMDKGAMDKGAMDAVPASENNYPTAKDNFSYGPGRAIPRLVMPPFSKPGPLADARDPIDPTLPCGTEFAAAPLDIGPKENWATKKAKQAALGALGSLFGGGGGGGGLFGSEGGGDFDDDDKPPTVKDSIPKSARQEFHDKLSDTELSISGRVNEEGLLLSTRIDDAPDKATFHHIYIEDSKCRRHFPDKLLNYKLWLEWSLSVSWTKTTKNYTNDELTSQKSESGSYFNSGTTDLGQGSINLSDFAGSDAYQQQLLSEMPPPIWRRMGFSSPEAGVRGLGSRFAKVTPEQLQKGDSIAVVHFTQAVKGRYVSRGIPFKMSPGADGLIKFSRL